MTSGPHPSPPVDASRHPLRTALLLVAVLALCAAVGTIRPAPATAQASGSAAPASFPALIPEPVSVSPRAGAGFALDRSTRIVAHGEAGDAASVLADELRTSTSLPLPVRSHGSAHGTISIRVVRGGAPAGHEKEGYRLHVDSRSVRVEASTREGALNGVRTLEQLFGAWATSSTSAATPQLTAPAVEITDHPRFAYRGFGLDVARSFYGVDEVESVIDRASRVKLNVLHLHLSDDQGWRIAIDGDQDTTSGIDYSRLTSISGGTAMTNDAQGEPMGTEPGRSGYYTKHQYRQIVEYAQRHGVTVVPEIDVPGHTNAALHAVPQLTSPGSLPQPAEGEATPPVNGTPDVGYSSLDVANPASDAFVRTVMGELAAMTPGPYLHMGGDESHSTPEEDYRTMVGRFAADVQDTGKTVIGWNEYAAADLPEGAVVQYWNGDKKKVADDVLRNDARVILSPADRAYVPQRAADDQRQGATWACDGSCTLPDWYAWDPAGTLPGVDEHRVLGVEAVHWGEWIRGIDQMDSYTWPRALATAEVAWSPQSSRDTDDFLGRAGRMMPALQLAGVNAHPVPEVAAAPTVSAAVHGRGAHTRVSIRTSAASVDPSDLSARLVERSGRTRAIDLSEEKDTDQPTVVTSALSGTLRARPLPRGAHVELLRDDEVIARSTIQH